MKANIRPLLCGRLKTFRAIILLVLIAVPSFGTTAESNALLDDLGANLRQARSLPMGAKTNYRCPEGLEILVGMQIAIIVDALPKPDYFLTCPVPPGKRGGGFPQVTFFSGKDNKIESVTCFYAR